MPYGMHVWCEAKLNACHWVAVYPAGLRKLSGQHSILNCMGHS